MHKLRKLIKDMDKVLLVLTIVLFVFGLLNIVTASAKISVIRYTKSLYYYFGKQSISLLAGLILSYFIINIPTKKYGSWIKILVSVVLALLLYILVAGEAWSGNANWIAIPGFGSVQPSEFAKPIMIVLLAYLFQRYHVRLKNHEQNHWDIIGKILFAGLMFPAIVFLQKDLGTTIILMLIFGVMFYTSPINKDDKLKVTGLGVGLLLVILLYGFVSGSSLLSESQKARFNFIDPCSDYYEGGYQICNGYIAINDGGLFGVGIGNSKQVSYIPESHTDSVFAIIAEEYGLIICTFIFISLLVILFRIFKLATRTKNMQNKYICYGIAMYIFFHILINLGGLFGIMPLTGVPLPFLSYGGSFTMTLCASLAVVQRIHIETKNEKIVV